MAHCLAKSLILHVCWYIKMRGSVLRRPYQAINDRQKVRWIKVMGCVTYTNCIKLQKLCTKEDNECLQDQVCQTGKNSLVLCWNRLGPSYTSKFFWASRLFALTLSTRPRQLLYSTESQAWLDIPSLPQPPAPFHSWLRAMVLSHLKPPNACSPPPPPTGPSLTAQSLLWDSVPLASCFSRHSCLSVPRYGPAVCSPILLASIYLLYISSSCLLFHCSGLGLHAVPLLWPRVACSSTPLDYSCLLFHFSALQLPVFYTCGLQLPALPLI